MHDVSSASNSRTVSSSSSIFINYPLFSAIIAFALAQFYKFFTAWYKEKKWDPKKLIASGGMPSSHSATVTALATAIGVQEGFGGPMFATSLILACIDSGNPWMEYSGDFGDFGQYFLYRLVNDGDFEVMYDATGIRLQAGRQAEVLNQIVYDLPAEHPLAESIPLHELLGHTPPQVVAGGLLGVITGVIGYVVTLAIG